MGGQQWLHPRRPSCFLRNGNVRETNGARVTVSTGEVQFGHMDVESLCEGRCTVPTARLICPACRRFCLPSPRALLSAALMFIRGATLACRRCDPSWVQPQSVARDFLELSLRKVRGCDASQFQRFCRVILDGDSFRAFCACVSYSSFFIIILNGSLGTTAALRKKFVALKSADDGTTEATQLW